MLKLWTGRGKRLFWGFIVFVGIMLSPHMVWGESIQANNQDVQVVFSIEEVKTGVFGGLCGFDIDDKNGKIALGICSPGGKMFVSIYNWEMQFLYGYQLKSETGFDVLWEAGNLWIICQEGSYFVDENGKAQRGILSQNEFEIARESKREVNGIKFYLSDNTSADSYMRGKKMYAQLVRIDKDQTETVLYDDSLRYNLFAWSGIIIIGIFFIVGIPVVIRKTIRNKFKPCTTSSQSMRSSQKDIFLSKQEITTEAPRTKWVSGKELCHDDEKKGPME